MADYIALRKGRNALSTVLHIVFNIALAIISTALTVISNTWVLGVLLVLLSKWRIVAVRPRYWWVNLKANLVDLTVGISLALLVYRVGVDNGLSIWHIILTLFYAVWLVFIKPRSEAVMTELQAIFAIYFGTFAAALFTSQYDPIVCVAVCFVIGYGASRHVLMQSNDHDFTFITFICGLLLAEMSWFFFHWSIVYQFSAIGTLAIPQLPIVASVLFFMLARGYKSALRHDGKIRVDDILVPAIFSVSVILLMVICYSEAFFNI